MPKVSSRQRTLADINQILFFLIIYDSGDNQEQINELLELKAHILSHRFFGASQTIPKSLEYRLNLLALPSSEFGQAFRMNKDTFLFILNHIQNHPVFSNNSFNKQQPVWAFSFAVLIFFNIQLNLDLTSLSV